MIKTSCENCVFKVGNPQTGCFVDRLEKFKELKCVEEQNGYYNILRFCNYNIKDSASGFDLFEIQSKVKKAMTVQVDFIVMLEHEKIINFLQDIQNQTIKPKKITVVTPDFNLKNNDVYKATIGDFCKLEITSFLGATKEKMIDQIVLKSKSDFYGIVDNELPKHNLIELIEKAYNEDLVRFCMINGPVKLYQNYTHKVLGGNDVFKSESGHTLYNLEDKIKLLQEEQGTNMVLDL